MAWAEGGTKLLSYPGYPELAFNTFLGVYVYDVCQIEKNDHGHLAGSIGRAGDSISGHEFQPHVGI